SCVYVETTAKTNRAISILYSLQHTSASLFRADTLSPIRFVTDQTANSKQRLRKVDFDSDGKIVSSLLKEGKEIEHLEFHSTNTTLDPISAAFLARTLPAELGTKESFDVFNGKHRFLISFEVVGRERIKVNGEMRDAFKVQPNVQKLTDTK